MAPDQDIENHKNALLAAIRNRDWEYANTERNWLSQNLHPSQVTEFCPDLLVALDHAIGDDCEESIAFNMRGNTKHLLDDYQGAIADYDKAIEIDPNHAGAFNNRGCIKKILDDYHGAIADFDKAIDLNSDDAGFYNNRGSTKEIINDYQGAILDYSKSIQINQNDADVYYNRGNARYQIGDYHGSIEDLDAVIQLDQDYVNAYHDRAVAKNSLGKYQKAIADLDIAIKLSPDDINLYYARAIIHRHVNDYLGIIEDLSQIIKLNPNDYEAYGNRGVAKGFMEKHQESIVDFNMAIDINPNDANAYSNRGSAKDHLGDYQGAIDDYDRAIFIQPDNPLHYHLKGLVLLKIGENQKADQYFRVFFEKNNEDNYEKDKNNLVRNKRGKKSNKHQLYKKLNDIPDELSFLTFGRDRIKGRSHHENVLYLYALLDHAMRNTLCYIAVVNLKCNFELTKKHLDLFRYDMRNFGDKIKNTLIDITKYPEKKSEVIQNLNIAILTRNNLAHGKKIGKSSSSSENIKNRWEAISDVTEAQCCRACIYFVDFFIEYLKFFNDHIQNKKRKNKFNPFDGNFQGFIGTRWLNEQQTELILRGIGIIKSSNQSNNKNSK